VSSSNLSAFLRLIQNLCLCCDILVCMSLRKSTPLRQVQRYSFRLFISTLMSDKIIVVSFKYITFLLVTYILIVGIFIFRLPPQIPLFYSRPWGTEQLARSSFVFVVFAINLFIIIFNSILSAFFLEKEKLLSYTLMWTIVLYLLLIDITIIKVFLLFF
jgi:hypothetical protein